MQLQNPDSQPRPLTITFYSPLGVNANSSTDVLRARSSQFYSPNFPGPFSGTVRVADGLPLLGVVTHFGVNDDPIGAAQWPLVDDADVDKLAYVPHFEARTNGPSSRMTLHNLEPLVATANLTFYDSSGLVVLTHTVQVPPLGALAVTGASLGVQPLFSASAVISSNRTIYVNSDRIYNGAFASAQGAAHGGRRLVAPWFTSQFGFLNTTLSSELVLQNVGQLTATVMISYYEGANGNLISTQQSALAPYAAYRFVSTTAGKYGQVIATADQPLVGLVLGNSIGAADLWDYTAVIVEPEQVDAIDRRTLYGPTVFSQYRGWFDRLLIANPTAVPALVTIAYTSAPTGTLLTTSLNVPPFGVGTTDTSALPREFEHASVTISSNQIIAATLFAISTDNIPDHFMAYEAQYARPTWHLYLPLIMR